METKSLYAKLRELSGILDTVERIQNNQASPLFIWSIFVALVWFALSFLGNHNSSYMWVLSCLGIDNSNYMWVPFVLGPVSFFVAYRTLPIANSWTRDLDSRMSAYQPLDRDAYVKLHVKTRELGGFDLSMVKDWIEIERKTIDASIPRAMPGTASEFIKKSVEDTHAD